MNDGGGLAVGGRAGERDGRGGRFYSGVAERWGVPEVWVPFPLYPERRERINRRRGTGLRAPSLLGRAWRGRAGAWQQGWRTNSREAGRQHGGKLPWQAGSREKQKQDASSPSPEREAPSAVASAKPREPLAAASAWPGEAARQRPVAARGSDRPPRRRTSAAVPPRPTAPPGRKGGRPSAAVLPRPGRAAGEGGRPAAAGEGGPPRATVIAGEKGGERVCGELRRCRVQSPAWSTSKGSGGQELDWGGGGGCNYGLRAREVNNPRSAMAMASAARERRWVGSRSDKVRVIERWVSLVSHYRTGV